MCTESYLCVVCVGSLSIVSRMFDDAIGMLLGTWRTLTCSAMLSMFCACCTTLRCSPHQPRQRCLCIRLQQADQCAGLQVVCNDLRRDAVTVLHVLRLFVLFTPLAMSAPLVFYFGVSRQAWMEKLRETMEAAGVPVALPHIAFFLSFVLSCKN